MKQAPQSILVINVTRIGDMLLAVPALRALATAWPGAHLSVLGHLKRVRGPDRIFVSRCAPSGGISSEQSRINARRYKVVEEAMPHSENAADAAFHQHCLGRVD